jgi:hypothetical protein
MPLETPLPRDNATDDVCWSCGGDALHRDRVPLQSDHRPSGLGAAISWVIVQFVEGFAAHGAAMCGHIWPPHERRTPRSATRDDGAPRQPSP